GADIVWSISSQSGPTANRSEERRVAKGSKPLLLTPPKQHKSDSYTVTITGTVNANDADPTTFLGTGIKTTTVQANNETTAEQNQSASATVNTTAPDVDITKTTSTPTVNAGGTASFTVTVFNEGTGDATGVSFSDPLPAGLGADIVWSISSQSGPTANAFSLDNSTAG